MTGEVLINYSDQAEEQEDEVGKVYRGISPRVNPALSSCLLCLVPWRCSGVWLLSDVIRVDPPSEPPFTREHGDIGQVITNITVLGSLSLSLNTVRKHLLKG